MKNITTINNTNNDNALSWWLSLTFEEKFYKTISWLKNNNRNTTERHPNELTVYEIRDVYKHSI